MFQFRTPRKFLHWLLLLTPAANVILLPFTVGNLGLSFRAEGTLLIGAFFASIAGCFALGIWQAWSGQTWPDRLVGGCLAGIVLVLLNGLVALAGLAVAGLIY
jgi:hypothetical protein